MASRRAGSSSGRCVGDVHATPTVPVTCRAVEGDRPTPDIQWVEPSGHTTCARPVGDAIDGVRTGVRTGRDRRDETWTGRCRSVPAKPRAVAEEASERCPNSGTGACPSASAETPPRRGAECSLRSERRRGGHRVTADRRSQHARGRTGRWWCVRGWCPCGGRRGGRARRVPSCDARGSRSSVARPGGDSTSRTERQSTSASDQLYSASAAVDHSTMRQAVSVTTTAQGIALMICSSLIDTSINAIST